MKQPEPEARRVATALELYCTGSLNLFNHQTNVKLTSHICLLYTSFDVSQTVIAQAGGLIQGSTDITPDMMAELETTLEGMDLGPLLGL